MRLGGLEKLSLLDFPDQVAAIVFTQGCNFRCHFCYNPLLVWPEVELDARKYEKNYSPLSEDSFFDFLKERRGKLDGVVITGGEPTLHADLPEFIQKIRALGYLVKLDTNGTNPLMVERLLAEKSLDYIAMDLKAPLDKYEATVGVPVNLQALEKSVKMIISSNLPHEFRTTLVPGLITIDDITFMGHTIKGAQAWYLQKFKSDTPLVDRSLEQAAPFTSQDMARMAELGAQFVRLCEVR
jgi:pyruvate formate lyase activating enzyme